MVKGSLRSAQVWQYSKLFSLNHSIFQKSSISSLLCLHKRRGLNTNMAHKNYIEHTLRCQWCWNISVPWDFSHVLGNFPFGPSVIVFLHDTQTPYPGVAGGRHITLSKQESLLLLDDRIVFVMELLVSFYLWYLYSTLLIQHLILISSLWACVWSP